MKNILFLFLFAFAWIACSDDYDDSQAWKSIDALYKDLDQVKSQLQSLQTQTDALSQIISGGAITSISPLAGGGYTVYYKASNNVEHSFVIAEKSQMTTAPIIGVSLENGVYYWTTTVEGVTAFLLDAFQQKIPVTGATPQIKVDSEGYWTLNGVRVLNDKQEPVKAEGKESSLITQVVINPNGTASLTLGDGQVVEVAAFTLFNVELRKGEQLLTNQIEVEEGLSSLTLSYQVVGSQAAQALLMITRAEGLSASLSTPNKSLQLSFPTHFSEGSLMLVLYDNLNNVLIKPLFFNLPLIENGGISTASQFLDFITAVNNGSSLRAFSNTGGEVVLLQNIDMSGQVITAGAGDPVTVGNPAANSAVVYTPGLRQFNGVFNGQGYKLYNLQCQYNVEDGNLAHGLFRSIGGTAVIKNLTVEGEVTIAGNSPQGLAIGGLVGYSQGQLLACNNRLNIAYNGSNNVNYTVRIGGLVGVQDGNTIGDGTEMNACINYGTLSCGSIANNSSGANGAFQQGGIVGYLQAAGANINYAINEGVISGPSGRGGGIVGTLAHGTIENCINRGTVQDDINDVFASNSARYNIKRMGGLVGGSGANTYIINSSNQGLVLSPNGCRTGGIIGHNGGYVQACSNTGIVLSDYLEVGTAKHGAGWVAGFSSAGDTFVTDCVIGGKVGDYSLYKNNPSQAPDATYSNAVCHGGFSPEKNNFSSQDEAFYDWTVETTSLGTGVVLKHYSFTSFSQNIYALEIDLTQSSVSIETAIANEICPSPNGNNNSNNGKNLRETLSETCQRRRSLGRNIVAGINTGFFNSHDGFPRGMHIEEGEPVFVNNPYVRTALVNHRPGFTQFEDRSISFENREFTGKIKVNSAEYEYFSINDTLVRLNGTPSYDANVYTHRFVAQPQPGISNPIGSKALFIVAKSSQSLQVNSGYIDATVTQIIDGRNNSVSAPYVTTSGEWVLQVTGQKADQLASALSVGQSLQIMAELKIGGSTKKIKVHNSSMYRYVYNGVYSPPSKIEDAQVVDPTTNVGLTADKNTLVFFCVDGRSSNDRGLNFYEAYRVAKKMGLHDVVRFDGGGSTTLWAYFNGSGAVRNTPSDSKGERSCMNYLHVRINQ